MIDREVLGAGNETRTRDPNLGKVVLYQLSYSRQNAEGIVTTSDALSSVWEPGQRFPLRASLVCGSCGWPLRATGRQGAASGLIRKTVAVMWVP